MDSKEQEGVYQCDDDSLGAMLHRLFQEGHDEVEIMHPTDGPRVITKDEFYAHVDSIKKAINMSPAERLVKRKQVDNLARQKQIRFRTAMITAQSFKVDLEDDSSFGYDIDGNKLDIEGMTFVRAEEYLPGIQLLSGEIGCFVDELEEKKPIRITA